LLIFIKLLKDVMLVLIKITYCTIHAFSQQLRKLAGLQNSVCGPVVGQHWSRK